jgi:hypothetical protein
LANSEVLNIVPHRDVLVRQKSLENPTWKALACNLKIGSPTVPHEPRLSTAYGNSGGYFQQSIPPFFETGKLSL